MKGRDLRVAVAGAGMVSAHHLVGWRRAPGVLLVGLADLDAARAKARADAFGIARSFTDVAAMLDETEPDVLDIATPLATHAALVALAARRGVHVLCQKPLAGTAAEARAVAATVPPAVRLMVHENWRFRPVYRALRRWIAEGAIGPVIGFQMSVFGSGLLPCSDGTVPALERQPFMATMPRLLVLELLVHHLDTLASLVGPLTVAGARLARVSPAVRGEDTAIVWLAGADAVAGSLTACMTAAGQPARTRDTLLILGRAGTAACRGSRAVLTPVAGERMVLSGPADIAYQASYDAAINHFVTCLRSGTPFETDAATHIAALELVEAIYAAAAAMEPA